MVEDNLKLLKQREKTIKAEEKLLKTKHKLSEKKSKSWKDLKKTLSKKVISKRVLKPSKMTLEIREHTPAEYEPIYFKNELEEAKKSLFL